MLVLLAACRAPASTPADRVIAAAVTPSPAPTARPTPTPEPTPIPVMDVPYRVEVRVPDGHGFRELLAATMADPRGWSRAGFRVHEDAAAPFTVLLVEGEEAQRLCLPYDVGSEYSCQNGPLVVINARRWRQGVPHWPLGLEAYRVMLLNHEMGHLIGQRHRDCPGAGAPAPVMQQQSGGLDGCRANPWPLPDEIARAARHDQPLAPAYGE